MSKGKGEIFEKLKTKFKFDCPHCEKRIKITAVTTAIKVSFDLITNEVSHYIIALKKVYVWNSFSSMKAPREALHQWVSLNMFLVNTLGVESMRRITWLYTPTSLINSFIKRAILMETYMPLIEQLKEVTHESVRDVKEKHVGIAFSGGVDSSVLAKVCENESKNTTLLTVGFASRRDIKISNEVSGELDLELVNMFIPLGELEKGLQEVLSIIEFDRIARLENSVCFYYVFQLAVRQGLDTVLSANGIDELFCGYDVYRRRFGDEDSMISLTESLVKTAKEDKEEIDKVSASFGIKYICPFLSDDFVDFAMEIPLDFKIRGENDNIRKHIWREAALEIGIPRFAALRAKRAFQYSSGVHKAIRKLATKKGFTKKKARSEGFRSRTEAYISNLK